MFSFKSVSKCLFDVITFVCFLTFAVMLEILFAVYKITKHDYDIQISQPRCKHIRYARDLSPKAHGR